MVPGAVDAHLDRIAAELIVIVDKLSNPALRVDHSSRKLFQLVAEDIPHLAESVLIAYGAATPQWDADVLRGPHQFRVRVADLELVYGPAPELLENQTPREGVVGDRRASAPEAPGPTGRFSLFRKLGAQSAAILAVRGARLPTRTPEPHEPLQGIGGIGPPIRAGRQQELDTGRSDRWRELRSLWWSGFPP